MTAHSGGGDLAARFHTQGTTANKRNKTSPSCCERAPHQRQTPDMSMREWLSRAQKAATNGERLPEAQLFRRMVEHGQWFRSGPDIYCDSALLPPGAAPTPPSWDGLQLASSVEDDVADLHVHFEAGMPPLTLDADQALHLRSFLQSMLHARSHPPKPLLHVPLADLLAMPFALVCQLP